MTNKFELYKCNVCGNVIEILISGDGHPVCCGEEMQKLENKNDNLNSPDLTEKHSPLIEQHDDNITISTLKHPMTKEHHIMFLQTISKDQTQSHIQFFNPEEQATMTSLNNSDIIARSYCNIHGVYIS